MQKFSLLTGQEIADIMYRLDGNLKQILKRVAVEKGMSYSAYINLVLTRHIEEMCKETHGA